MLLRTSAVAILVACVSLTTPVGASAQTINDYSRAQRAWLESAMSQSAARSAGVTASAPSASAPAFAPMSAPVPASVPPMPGPHASLMPTLDLAPAIQVSGVFASSSATVAEVVVNATAYLLQVGQGVPGTAWQVDAIEVDHVVLARRGASRGGGSDTVRRVFALPAMR